MKLIDLHKEWMEGGKMPESGLCRVFSYIVQEDYYWELFQLFRPTVEEKDQLISEGKSSFFWGSDSENWCSTQYTPFRQSIVLLICAMNNEL